MLNPSRTPTWMVGTLMLLLSILATFPEPATADSRLRYKNLNYSNPGRYDYAPSVLWDDTSNQWVMFTCSSNPSTLSDGIFRWKSSNGVDWTADGLPLGGNPVGAVLAISSPPNWDSGHVCDPTVLKNVSIVVNGTTWQWAMWYTGTASSGGVGNSIGLAVSNDGKNWVRHVGNPIINCSSQQAGCSQPSVVYLNGTYHMSHTRWFDGDPDGSRKIAYQTSSNGSSWTLVSFFFMPSNTLSPDFMYANGTWYSVIHGSVFEHRVYTSATMDGVKTLVGVLTNVDTPFGSGGYFGEAGFYRDAFGQAPGPDIWLAYGLGYNLMHDASEEIRAAKLSLFDGEDGVGAWGAWGCNGGLGMSGPIYAWGTVNGPKDNDINFWDVISDGDGTVALANGEYCDMLLKVENSSFAGENGSLNDAGHLEVTWSGATNTGWQAGFEAWIQNSGTWYRVGEVYRPISTVFVERFPLNIPRDHVQWILFRVKELYFTPPGVPGTYQRTHLFKVQAVN